MRPRGPSSVGSRLSGYGARHSVSRRRRLEEEEERLRETTRLAVQRKAVPILSVFPTLIVHSELKKSVHPGFPVAFIF